MGPTYDGRFKPDVTGPGYQIVSAYTPGPTGDEKNCGVYETFGIYFIFYILFFHLKINSLINK